MEHATSLDMAEHVARLLIEMEAVKVNVDEFFRFVSGILSPVYVDNRKLISYPDARKVVVSYLVDVVLEKIGEPNFELVAGTATAGIPWAAWVANELDIPLIYVRPSPKERGTKKQIEGVLKVGQRAVVVEDLITTGLSSSNVTEAIRAAQGIVNHCIAIFSFGAPSAVERFRTHQLKSWTLTDLSALLRAAKIGGYFSDVEIEAVERWATTSLASFQM